MWYGVMLSALLIGAGASSILIMIGAMLVH
jgi:hypothetical protein